MAKKCLALLLIVSIIVMSGCYGSFTLTHKIYRWNGTLEDKYVQNIVFWLLLILPVYEGCAFIDAVALNVIEFWVGSNPLALQDQEKERLIPSGDKLYSVKMGNNEIRITQVKGPDAGSEVSLVYDNETQAWFLKEGNTWTRIAALDLKDRAEMRLFYPDGKAEKINLN